MRILLNDLHREGKMVRSKTLRAIKKVVNNHNFILGKEVADFEKKFAKYCGVKYSIGVANGTAALFLALKSLGIGRGDEVITSVISFGATVEAIIHTGATPVFVDVDPLNLSINSDLVEQKITTKTKAILPVHLYGFPADLPKLKSICDKYNLLLINDSAQAHGARFNKKSLASYGDISCFSFMPAKNLGAYGDAGCVVTNVKSIAEKIRMLRDHGRKDKYLHSFLGYAERMDTVQAAVLAQKIDTLDSWNTQRQNVARAYDKGFLNNNRVQFCRAYTNSTPVYHLYVISLKNRDFVRTQLAKNNIDSGIHYPIPLHLQPAFKYLGYKLGDFPLAEHYCKKILSLPMHPFLKHSEISKIIRIVNEYAK